MLLLEKSLISARKGYEVRAAMWTMTRKRTPKHIKDCYWAQGKKLLATWFVSMENLQEYWERVQDLGSIVIFHGAGKEKEMKIRQGQHILTVSAMEYSELSFFARP